MAKIYYSKQLNQVFLTNLKEKLKQEFKDCKTIAIKIHFGEPGNKTAFTPEQIKPIANILEQLNINFFLYDSPVAYNSPRNTPEGHKKVAISKGWDKLGEIRTNDDYLTIKGNSMSYEVCQELIKADAVLVISHIKGHICSGFGGAIKNLGMGALTKKTKGDIHSGGKPILLDGCTQCKTCEKMCPIKGITVTDKPNFNTCYGCSNCIYVCPAKVLKPKVNYFDVLLAEGAYAAESNFKKVYYISYIVNISKECDCGKDGKEIISQEEGYLFGENGVAIDKAAYDLLTKEEPIFLKHNQKKGNEQIKAAEECGMGTQEYELINVMIRNVALILLYNKEKRVLFQHRSDDAERLPDYWAFFGGGIDEGETPEQAVKRETMEELNYKLEKPKLIMVQNFKGVHYNGMKYVFTEEYNPSKKIELREGKGMSWLTFDEFLKRKIVNHDKEVIEKIKDKF